MKKTYLSKTQFENFDFRELPIGVYMTSLDGQFIECNTMLRKMLDLPLDVAVNANIKDYYTNPTDREGAIERAIDIAEKGKSIDKGILHLKVDDRDVFVEDYCKILQDDNGEVVGFVGCMVDVTSEIDSRRHEKELQELVDELRFDIGRILHANTTTLLMVKQTLDAVADAFEPKPNWEMSLPSAEEVESILTENANFLANTIDRFVQGADEERRLKALPQYQWQKLKNFVDFLREFKERILTPESYPATLRKLANDVGKIHSAIESGHLSREQLRELQNTAWQLEKLTTLIEVLETRTAVIQMDYTIHSLREFITSDHRKPVKHARVSIKSLIEDCAKRMAEYARSLKIDIDSRELGDVLILVNERDMNRALSNILHNAIKYSWQRDPERSKRAWVSIRTFVKDQMVRVEFENWGVPVKREEIEQGKVFDLGYRGELSKDRGRLGTGIGLTDARRVAEAHGGSLEMESHPAVRGIFDERDKRYYQQPFITTVTLILPVAQNQ